MEASEESPTDMQKVTPETYLSDSSERVDYTWSESETELLPATGLREDELLLESSGASPATCRVSPQGGQTTLPTDSSDGGTPGYCERIPTPTLREEHLSVDLSQDDSLPWLPSGHQHIALTDITYEVHRFRLCTTSHKDGQWPETLECHGEHEVLVDALTRSNSNKGLYYLASNYSRASASTVLVSLANHAGIIGLCILQSAPKAQHTRSPPSWNVSQLFTDVAFRDKGIASALLRLAMTQAMLLLPCAISCRSGVTISNILSHAGFVQEGPVYNWIYHHCPRIPQPSLVDSTMRSPTSIRTDARFCYILSTLQVIGGQPGLLDWVLQQKWPHFRAGYSVAMLLAGDTLAPDDKPSTCALLASLYFNLVHHNKGIQGHSPRGREDQDSFDLFLALLSCWDRELRPIQAPVFRVTREDTLSCANGACSASRSFSVHDRVLRVVVPEQGPSWRLEHLLARQAEPESRTVTCGTCRGVNQSYTTAITDVTQDVAVHLLRGQFCKGKVFVCATPVHLPTQFQLDVGGVKVPLRLHSMLLYGQWTDKKGNVEKHWLVITRRHVRPNTQKPAAGMWYLADDDAITPLGDIGPYEDNTTICLNHTALERFGVTVVCGAFYSRYSAELSPSGLTLRPRPSYYTPTLESALRKLGLAGIQTARCAWHSHLTQAELQRLVTQPLRAQSPITLQAPYLRASLSKLDAALRSSRVRLAKEKGSQLRTFLFRDTLDRKWAGWGHAEAVEGGLQSKDLSGHGREFARQLGEQLGISLLDPAGIVITCGPYTTQFHHHLYPVLNTGITSGSSGIDHVRAPWETAGLHQGVTKTYLFTSVATLETLGVNVNETGSMDLDTLLSRISRMSAVSRRLLRFEWAIMDGQETTHVIFPGRTLHWVATEPCHTNNSPAVYCGVGAYFFPSDLEAAHSLQDSIQSFSHVKHTARQHPSPMDGKQLLEAHIAAQETVRLTSRDIPPAPILEALASNSTPVSEPTVVLEQAAPIDPHA